MDWVWRAKGFGFACAVLCAQWVAGQTPGEPNVEGKAPLLTLGSPMIRSTMDRVNLPWLIPEMLPEFRLKVARSAAIPLSPAEVEGRLRGVEFRLPMKGLWVGYETPFEGEEPRATVSIQRGF